MSHRPPVTSTPPAPVDDGASLLVEEPRFSLVPEWVIDAPVPDSSFRLYCLLLRYGGSSGQRMPSRTTLARRLRRSVDAVDRAMKELVAAGVVRVEHRRDGQRYLSNRYHVRTSSPWPADAPPAPWDGRRSAATPAGAGGGRASASTAGDPAGGRTGAATPGRRSAAGVAADLRHDREVLTQSTNPPPPAPVVPASGDGRTAGEEERSDRGLLATCGVEDLDEVVRRCVAARRALGLSTTRWAGPCLSAALHLAVRGRGWPAELAVPALLAVAADPATSSPMRLAEAGPWWDQAATIGAVDGAEADGYGPERVAADEQRLGDLPGGRHVVQAAARAELAREGMPLTRTTVVRRACEILDREAAG